MPSTIQWLQASTRDLAGVALAELAQRTGRLAAIAALASWLLSRQNEREGEASLPTPLVLAIKQLCAWVTHGVQRQGEASSQQSPPAATVSH